MGGTAPRFYRKHLPTPVRRMAETANYYNTAQDAPIIDRQKPGHGYLHLLKKADVEAFVELLPEWPTLSDALDAIVLSPGHPEFYGWHIPGVIHICAWHRGLWETASFEAVEHDLDVFERLGVPVEKHKGKYQIQWTRLTARAFQLIEVLLHELGHHYDRITTRSLRDPARGEPFAHEFAESMRQRIWERFCARFELS